MNTCTKFARTWAATACLLFVAVLLISVPAMPAFGSDTESSQPDTETIPSFDEWLEKLAPQVRADIETIMESPQSLESLLEHILETRDVDRLVQLLGPLMEQSPKLDDEEVIRWLDALPVMSFEQQFRLLEILARERQKSGPLNRHYLREIDRLNQEMEMWQYCRCIATSTTGHQNPSLSPSPVTGQNHGYIH